MTKVDNKFNVIQSLINSHHEATLKATRDKVNSLKKDPPATDVNVEQQQQLQTAENQVFDEPMAHDSGNKTEHVSVSAGDDFVTLHRDVIKEVNLSSPGRDPTKHDIIIQGSHSSKKVSPITTPTQENTVIASILVPMLMSLLLLTNLLNMSLRLKKIRIQKSLILPKQCNTCY